MEFILNRVDYSSCHGMTTVQLWMQTFSPMRKSFRKIPKNGIVYLLTESEMKKLNLLP